MEALFLFLYRVFKKRRIRLFLLVMLVMGVAAYLASRMRLEEDITRMISGGGSPGITGRVVEQSKFLDKIIIIASSGRHYKTRDT